MKDSQFDNHLQNTLYSHPSPVDSARIWTGVEAGLQGRRKIGNWVFWLGAFLFLFFMGSMVYMALPGKIDNRGEQISEIRSSESTTSIVQSHDHSMQVDHIRNSENFSPGISEKADSLFSDSGKNENINSAPIITPQGMFPAGDEPAFAKNAEMEATIEKEESGPKAANNSSAFIEKNLENHDMETVVDEVFNSPHSSTPETGVKPELESSINSLYSDLEDSKPELSLIIPLKTQFDQISGSLMLSEENFMASYVLNTDRQNSPWFLQISAGAGLVDRSITSLHSAFNQYATLRSQTESPLEYQSFQGSIGYNLKNGFYISGGLNITTINEHFHLDREQVSTHEQTVITHIHVNAEGDSVFQTGTAVTTIHHSEHFSHFNKYTLIDIPVFLGYEWQFNRWTAGAEVGILWNLSLRTRGAMLAVSDEVVRMEDSNAFHNHLNQNYAINLRFGYALSERLSLNLSPGVRFIHRSVLTMDQLDQHYRLLGVQGGLVYRLR